MFEHAEHHSQQGFGCMCEGDCGGHGGYSGHFRRHFETKAEKVEGLESYLNDLKTEIQGVEEYLSELKKK